MGRAGDSGTDGPDRDIVAFHSQFFNVIAELFPSLTDLHYGIASEGSAGRGWLGMLGRLRAGPRRLLERIVSVADMTSWPAASRGVDLGCGLGGTSLYLAERFGFEMTGVNINASQLRLARDRLRGRVGAPRIRLRQGDACALELGDGSRDFAVMIEVAFHIQDKAQLFREVARVLRPGGRFVLVDQEGAAPRGVMGLFWFAQEGEYRQLAADAGLETEAEEDLTAAVARWMEDYARTASLPFHAGAVAAALVRRNVGLAWRYLRGVRYFSQLVQEELARQGVELGWTHPLAGVRLLREHTLAEFRRGHMRYKVFVFRKAHGEGMRS